MDLIALLLGFSVLIGVGILVYKEHRISQKPVWLIISEMVQFNVPSIMMMALVSIGVVEALLAGFTHIPGKLAISTPVRVSAHILFNVVGFTAAMALKPVAVQLAGSIINIKERYYAIAANLVLLLGLFFITFVMPVLNLTLTANSIGEVDKLGFFLARLNPFVSLESYYQLVAASGLNPTTYSTVSGMSNPLLLMCATVFVHIILSLFISIQTIGYVFEKKEAPSTNPQPAPNANPQSANQPQQNAAHDVASKYLIAMVKLVEPTINQVDLDAMVKQGTEALRKSMTPPQVAAWTSKVGSTLDKHKQAPTQGHVDAIEKLLTDGIVDGGLGIDFPNA